MSLERKNRIVFVLLIAVVIVAAVLASFGPTLFSGGTPRVELPSLIPPVDTQGPTPEQVGDGDFVPVGVTADTVQSVIATLERPVSYARTITLDTFAAETQYTATAKVWVDGAWTKVDMTQQSQPRGVQHTLVSEDTFYRWYGSSRTSVEGPAKQWDADLAQRIPSYQDVIDLDKTLITDTGYEEKNSLPCIYVEVAVSELGYLERYWISVGNGLLMASETLKHGSVILRMSSSAPESPISADIAFALPDGTVLHRAGVS